MIIHRRGLLCAISGSVVLLTAACGVTPSNQMVVENAVNADDQTVDDADDRAARLDQRAEELTEQANSARGRAHETLRADAAADLNEADAIRREGEEAGANAAADVEQRAGLMNSH